jgi:hypothetical protein
MRDTRLLMTACAIVLGLLGVAGSFLPDEVLGWLGVPTSPALLLLVQVLGALYLGFALLNWMTRFNLIGGIYSRPVAIGNLMHFLSGGLAMIKLLARAPELRSLWPIVLVYALVTVAFGLVLFRSPIQAPGKTEEK